jgi:hypothetical protein
VFFGKEPLPKKVKIVFEQRPSKLGRCSKSFFTKKSDHAFFPTD